jgi:hypothetical protein
MVLVAAGSSSQLRTRVRTAEDRNREAWQPWRGWRVESRSELTSLPCKVAFRAVFPKNSQPTVWYVLYDLRGVWQGSQSAFRTISQLFSPCGIGAVWRLFLSGKRKATKSFFAIVVRGRQHGMRRLAAAQSRPRGTRMQRG